MPARVLIFSDHPATAESIGETLSGTDGYNIAIVSSAAVGLERIGVESIDCVVLDDALADCSASEARRRIQADGADLPVVALVAPQTEESSSAAMKCVAVIRKDQGFVERLANVVREVVGRRELARAARRLAGGAFVGRDAEKTSLENAVNRGLARRGGVFLIEGEAGIGKTTLARQIATHAETREMRTLWGRCHHQEGAPPYWLWIQVLRAALQDSTAEEMQSALGTRGAAIVELIPDLARAGGSDSRHTGGMEGATLFQLFDCVTSFLVNQARRRPTLIILDDIHWADRSSLLLLQYLGRELGNAPVLVLCAYRDADLTSNEVARDTVAELRPASRSVRLKGLKKSEVAELISLFAEQTVPETFVHTIYRQTDGNPYFIEEMLRLLLEEGVLYHDGQRWSARPSFRQIPLPAGAREILERRIGNLSEHCRHVLAVAALIGRQFETDAVAHLTARPVRAIHEAIDEAVEARLLTRVYRQVGSYSFRQAMVQSFLHGTLAAGIRADMHRRYGEYLESIHSGDLSLHVSALTYHFLRAVDPEARAKAHQYALRAAARAENLLAHEQAARHYETALHAVPSSLGADVEDRLDILLKASECWWRAGDSAHARRVAMAAAEISYESGRADDFARAALAFAGRLQSFGAVACDQNVVRFLEEALDLLGDDESGLHARLLGRLAEEITFSDQQSRRDDLALRSVEMARRSGDRNALAAVLKSLHWALWTPENVESRLELADEIIEIATTARDPAMQFEGHLFRCLAMIELADVASVHNELATCARLALDLRQPYNHWLVASTQVCVAMAEGRLSDVVGLAQNARELGEKAQSVNAALTHDIQVTHLYWLRGDYLKRMQMIQRIGENHPLLTSTMHAVRAHMFAAQGMRDAARCEFDHIAVGDFAKLPRNVAFAMSLAFLSEACAFLGDAPRAEQLYRMLLPFQHRLIVLVPVSCYGPASHYLGLLSATIGNIDDARRHFEDAVETSTRLGMKQFLARTQLAYAELLMSQGEYGAVPRELIEESLEICNLLEMSVLADRARAMLERLAQAPPTNRFRVDRPISDEARSSVRIRYANQRRTLNQPRITIRLRHEGRYRTFIRENQITRMGDLKGLRYLEYLLRQPGVDFHVLQLNQLVDGAPVDASTRSVVGGDGPDELHGSTVDEPILDSTGRRKINETLAYLKEEFEAAKANNDLERASRLWAEVEKVEQHLADGQRYRGKSCGSPGATERLRVSIRKAIVKVFDSLAPVDPYLERHLRRSIDTGAYCVYRPDPNHPVEWEFDVERAE